MTLEKKVHADSIFDACWSPDGTKILTASGDGSAKVFDAATLEEVGGFNFKSGDRKKTVAEQQVRRPRPSLTAHLATLPARAHPPHGTAVGGRRAHKAP